MDLGQRPTANGHLLGWADCVGDVGYKHLASHDAAGVLCLLSLVCGRGAGFLRLSIGRDAAGGGISVSVSGSRRHPSGPWSDAASSKGGDAAVVMGMVSDLLPVRGGEAQE